MQSLTEKGPDKYLGKAEVYIIKHRWKRKDESNESRKASILMKIVILKNVSGL